jgi:hypothetical protein
MSKKPKSSGPKTARGKARSALNAITHGFFSSQLASNEEEKALLSELRAQLRQELAPKGTLLELACDQVVACAWKLRRAMRLDQQCTTGWLRATAAAAQAGNGKGDAEGSEAVLNGVYGKSEATLRKQIALLDTVAQLGPVRYEDSDAGQRYGYVPPALLEEVRLTFGEPMAKMMEGWTGITTAHLMAAEGEYKRKRFNYPLPPTEPLSPEMQKVLGRAADELWVQVQQAQLHWLRGQLVAALQEVQSAAQASALGGSLSPELAQRYETGAARRLERALAQYFALKDRAERKREEED